MAITGISSIDNKQIIAAGALSAISANQALVTSGGDSLQGLYDTVSTNSGSWTGGGGGGGSVTSPSGTIIVNGSNIEATNSAVGTVVSPSASALLGNDVNINGPWDPSPSVFNFTLPVQHGTLYAIRTRYYGDESFYFSGKDLNGNITTGTMTVGGNPGTYTADLNDIVSDLSAQGTQSDVRMEQFYATSPSASENGVYELAWKKDVPTGQFFTGYNTYRTGSTSYSAVVDTDYKLTAGNATYSLIGAYTNANNKFNKLTGSNTLFEYSGYYEMGNIAYKPDIVGTINANRTDASPAEIRVEFQFNEWPVTSKIDKVYLTFDATQSGTVNDSKWKLLSRNNNHYEFVKYYPLSDHNPDVIDDWFKFDYGSWGTITNATASADIYSAFGIKELAFKDDLTGGSVPDEVMSATSAVSANSANWNETTDTLSANSGAWGGSALPISAGPGISLSMVDGVLVISTAGV
jgi:hypothetical protein